MIMPNSKFKKLIAEELSDIANRNGGCYILMPPSDSRLWRPGHHLLAKNRALGLIGATQDLFAKSAKRTTKGKASEPVAALKKATILETSFAGVAREWFDNNEARWVPSYSMRLKSRLEEDLITTLGDRQISKVAPMDVLMAIRQIEKRGAIESAKRAMHMAGAVFRYGVATGRCTRDPTADLKGALKPPKAPKHRAALPAKELPAFLEALNEYEGDVLTKLAMKFLILTFVRTSEVRFARWSEFEDLTGKEPLWRIPPERMKMRRPHLVPLAPQCVTLLKSLNRLTGKGALLFPANTVTGVISENTLIYAIYRMGYHSRATAHGFRSTASTVLNEAQFNRDWIELQLAHSDGSVRGVYNSAEWLVGRRKMMYWWADFIEGNSSGRPVSRVRRDR